MRKYAAKTMVFLLVCGCARAAPDAGLYDTPQRLRTGDGPTAAAVFDATGDGRADLVIANRGSNDLMLYAGDGNGALEFVARFEAGPDPESLAAGDFDEDGDLDLAIANHETRHLTLLVNDGKGRFVPGKGSPLTLTVRPHPHVVQAVDMNLDGHPDLIVDDREGEGFVLLHGAGDGSFDDTPRHIDAGGDPYLGMAIADLNDDSRPDIVAPLRRSVTVIVSENGDYSAPVRLPGGGAFAVHLSHLDADGRPDLIKATEAGEVALLRGLGGGRFGSGKIWRVGSGAKRIATGDLNGDGTTDIVVQNYMQPELFVLLSSPDGFEATSTEAGKHPWGIAISDLNGDDRDDIVSLDNGGNSAFIFLSPGGK